MDVSTFRAAGGVEDWRVLGTGLHARYRVASLEEAAGFATAVVAALPADGPVPDLDLRASSVTVHLPEHQAEEVFITDADLPAAQAVQRVARERGLVPDPASLRSVQLAVAAADGVDVRPFWQVILGYEPHGDVDARDPAERLPRLWFHELEHGGRGRGRTHVDVYVPAEEAERIVDAAVAAGGRIAGSSNPPHWWTLASPDNHGVDVAPWPDRG